MKKILFVLLSAVIVLFGLTAFADETPKENSFRYENGVPIQSAQDDENLVRLASDESGIQGIDVSTFQGDIDWQKVKDSGIAFAIIRCGYGDNLTQYDDTKWKRNADECTRLGIPFGAYLYSYAASTEEAKSEADHALRLLDGYRLSYPVYLDLEDKVVGACSNDLIGRIADIFCTTLQNAGYDVGIYANLNWWNNRLTSSVFDNPTWHKWVAQWGASCTYQGDYSMWQYTSSGTVDGISGNVDMDYWYESSADPPVVDYSYPNTYKNTGNLRKDIVGVASTQIGYTELTHKGGTPVGDSETPYYTKYGEAYGNPNGHWCAYFVLWCAKQANIPTSIICQSSGCGSCRIFIDWFKSNHNWRDNTYVPQCGDIIFFDWEQDGSADHVGIVQSVSGNTVYTIEGNTGGVNGYTVMERDRNSSIFGYGVPNYELINKINGYASKRATAYMLPDSSSQEVWYIAEDDELQVLCRDGNYYLVLYPFNYTGKFVAAYVPMDSVNLTGEVPDAEDYYRLLSVGMVKNNVAVYHNASEDSLIGADNSENKVRAELNAGDKIDVLFADGDYLFIRTDKVTGYVSKSDIMYDEKQTEPGDVNGDGAVDAGDAGLILRYDAGLITLTAEQIKNGDINGDSVTDAGDAGLILRKDAGLIK